MLRIGLTGGIGAGKSTVAREFADRGVPVIDADAVAREVVEPGRPTLARLAQRFGPEVLTADGALDRAALARLAFADDTGTRDLGAIMHPAIGARTRELMARHADAPMLVHDVPLLVENGLSADYHLCLLVDVPAPMRLERLTAQRGMDSADARARIERQAADEERYAACDALLSNTGTPAELTAAFGALWDRRLAPFAAALAAQRPASSAAANHSAPSDYGGPTGAPAESAPAAMRAHTAQRLAARLERAWAADGASAELTSASAPGGMTPGEAAPSGSAPGGGTPGDATAAPAPDAPDATVRLRVRARPEQAAAVRAGLRAAGLFPAAQRPGPAEAFAPADPGLCAAVELKLSPDPRSA
ncbi:dephospho-CoA kinase [Brevibacterium sp. 5221]|uniref:Dephospho-CoA kinase n=1 Tax=Brevibacterium rongguiense TaxID=2695267 RepID=A0A6N9H548_9MICO|nr:dephospho-CoA kinase [Brevibacterium rongguiense]MYM19187.1 dephospho-CoA kinase [Brevibacterium rongguiense]